VPAIDGFFGGDNGKQVLDGTAVMSVFNRLARKFTPGVFCFRLMVLMQACAVEGEH